MIDHRLTDAVCPDWYVLIRAAKYLGVSPWELAEQQTVWTDWALMAEAAEHEAEQHLREKAEKQAKAKQAAQARKKR